MRGGKRGTSGPEKGKRKAPGLLAGRDGKMRPISRCRLNHFEGGQKDILIPQKAPLRDKKRNEIHPDHFGRMDFLSDCTLFFVILRAQFALLERDRRPRRPAPARPEKGTPANCRGRPFLLKPPDDLNRPYPPLLLGRGDDDLLDQRRRKAVGERRVLCRGGAAQRLRVAADALGH